MKTLQMKKKEEEKNYNKQTNRQINDFAQLVHGQSKPLWWELCKIKRRRRKSRRKKAKKQTGKQANKQTNKHTHKQMFLAAWSMANQNLSDENCALGDHDDRDSPKKCPHEHFKDHILYTCAKMRVIFKIKQSQLHGECQPWSSFKIHNSST